MNRISTDFRDGGLYYSFVGFHSFLIGLLPFFLPVYLVNAGYGLEEISLFIGLTGAGFCFSLYVWDRWLRQRPLLVTLVLSFVVELLLIILLAVGTSNIPLLLLAFCNGGYSCFFWILQRALFFAATSADNAGRRFGNFQIMVTVFLKTGIVTGGLLLEHIGVWSVVVLSASTSVVGTYTVCRYALSSIPLSALAATPRIELHRLLSFRDVHGSRVFFAVDGIFLYLESYFWLISLFVLVRSSFWRLGLLVVLLGIGFSLLFYLLKNRIDFMSRQRVYSAGVGAYALSWLLRACAHKELDDMAVYLLLIVITFCTSVFRLSLNKRFFDIARSGTGYLYIIQKSYVSQAYIAITFTLFAFAVPADVVAETFLPWVYLAAACCVPLYFLYRQGGEQIRC